MVVKPRKPKRYGFRPYGVNVAPTKAEHDEKVNATGRPYTQPMWSSLGRQPKKRTPDTESQ